MGYIDPDDMLDRIPGWMIDEWRAFYIYQNRVEKEAYAQAEQEAKATEMARRALRR